MRNIKKTTNKVGMRRQDEETCCIADILGPGPQRCDMEVGTGLGNQSVWGWYCNSPHRNNIPRHVEPNLFVLCRCFGSSQNQSYQLIHGTVRRWLTICKLQLFCAMQHYEIMDEMELSQICCRRFLVPVRSTVEEDWVEFRDGLSECMDSHIPFKFSSSRNEKGLRITSSASWEGSKGISIMPELQVGTMTWRNSTQSGRKPREPLRRAYWNWVRTRCVESSKQFWSFVKKLRRNSMGIPALRKDGLLVSDDVGKPEILNAQFDSVFTSEEPVDNLPSSNKSYPIMPDISCLLRRCRQIVDWITGE